MLFAFPNNFWLSLSVEENDSSKEIYKILQIFLFKTQNVHGYFAVFWFMYQKEVISSGSLRALF